MKRFLPIFCVGVTAFCGCQAHAAPSVFAPLASVQNATISRPQYKMSADVDYAKRTFTNIAEITIPVAAGDSMKDVAFFIYANADGVANADVDASTKSETAPSSTGNPGAETPKKATETVKKATPNIVVESVSLDGAPLKFSLVGAVLKVQLPQTQTAAFTLNIKTNGRVPGAPAGSEGLGGMLSGIDLGSILGGTSSTRSKPKNQDYGLYTFGGNILSLGSFWYPTLAIRKNGKWLDAAPEGLGDVAYAEMSDYRVWISLPKTPKVLIGREKIPQFGGVFYDSLDEKTDLEYYPTFKARDFTVLMSDQYETKSKIFDVLGKQVRVLSFTTKANAAKADAAIEIAGRALQIYAKRFGAYNYDTFTVAEAPIRGGAGGMEYSGMTGISSMLYGDLGAQMGGLGDILGTSSTRSSTLSPTSSPAQTSSATGDVMAQQKALLDSLFEETIAHEVAHQWWAIGVGSDSANAPWLDESLTNYSSMIYWEDRYGKPKAQQMSDAHLKSSYVAARMFGAADEHADLRSSAYSNSLQYGAVVYGKGALFYGALRALVGDEKFFAALRTYYAKFNGKLAEKNSLRDIFKAQAPDKSARIDALYVRWIEGKNGDADINNGKTPSITDLLGGMFGQ